MTPEEFIVWLRGFAQAANNFTVTPKQWDDIKEKLSTVAIRESKHNHFGYSLDNNATTTGKVLLTDNTEL